MTADDLRHIAGSNMWDATRGDAVAVSGFLGNSPSIAMKHYINRTDKRRDEAMDKYERLFLPEQDLEHEEAQSS